MNNASRRGPWSHEEDQKLMELISIFGPTNWVRISNSLVSRSPKQCRERYHQNLKPSLNRTPISAEEGELIEQLVAKYGKKWAEIARHLNGRSDNAIKNWWNGGASKRRRASVQHEPVDDTPHQNQNHQNHQQSGQTLTPVASLTQPGAPGHYHYQEQGGPKDVDTASMMPPPAPYIAQHHSQPQPQPQTSIPGSQLSPPQQIPPPPQMAAQMPSQLPPPAQMAHQVIQLPAPNGPGGLGANSAPSVSSGQEDTRIAFNTSMFNNHHSNGSTDSLSPSRSAKQAAVQGIRSASFDYSNNSAHSTGNVNYPSQLPPLINKRRLFDDPLPSRRHSTAGTVNSLYSVPSGNGSYLALNHTNSHNNLVSLASGQTAGPHSGQGTQSPYNQSPLLLSNVNSRNNSISTTFDINLVGSTNNSGANSRRSSIAPDFFPNPLKEIGQHKRNISSNSLKGPAAANGLGTTASNGNSGIPPPLALNQPFTFHPLTSISNSPTQQSFNLNKSNTNLSTVVTSSNLNPNSPKMKEKGDKDKINDTKISVSSLID